jgi:hypothetical protein
MSNVHANAGFPKLRKKSREHTHPLHDNHPVFNPAAELCFELVQLGLNRSRQSDYHSQRKFDPISRPSIRVNKA